MSPKHHPPIGPHHPATFRERGVAVPFTTPALAGLRVRSSVCAELEMVMPNAVNGRDSYVLNSAAVRQRYRLTVHDCVLLQRLAGQTLLDPRIVRATAWQVAREGFAGEDARAAAEAVAMVDRSRRRLAEVQLLQALVQQAEPAEILADPLLTPDGRAEQVLHRLAGSFDCTGAQLGDALTDLANVFAPIGAAPDDPRSRVAHLIGRLRETLDAMVKAFASAPDNDAGRLGRSMITQMEGARISACQLLAASHAQLADPLGLLRIWTRTPAKVIALTTRAEWILDGWEPITLLWQWARSDAERGGAVLEMAQLIPVLPLEAMQWTHPALPEEALDPACRMIRQGDDRHRGGAAFMRIGRNEKLRAMSL